jgi:murein DD-endopeptidase MepM/ murein hydrolase activator NlpD
VKLNKAALLSIEFAAITLIALALCIIPSAPSTANSQLLIKPVEGVINREYSPQHTGVDICAMSGAYVFAAATGMVWDTRIESFPGDLRADGSGNYVIIQHKPGDFNRVGGYCPSEEWTKYMHLDKVYVQPGQYVQQGIIIGTVGNTGDTSSSLGLHLHFEIQENGYYGEAVNPRYYIDF